MQVLGFRYNKGSRVVLVSFVVGNVLPESVSFIKIITGMSS